MKETPKPDNRRTYDAAFRAEALRLAAQSRSTQAAARALNIDPKRLYQWQKAAQTPVAAVLGSALDPDTAAEPRQLRALARRQPQELDILKRAIAIFSVTQTPLAATASSPPNVDIATCGGSAKCSGCRPVGIMRGKRGSSGRWTSKRRLGERP